MVVKEYYLIMYSGSQEIVEINESYEKSFKFIRDFNIDDKLLLRVEEDNSFEIFYYKGDTIEKLQVEESESDIHPNTYLISKIIHSMKNIASSKPKTLHFYEYDITIDINNKIHHRMVKGVTA